jgi:inner membrane protein
MIEPLRNLAALVRAHYAFVKMGFLLALVLVLLIPLDLIGGLIAERMARRDAVLTEIGQTWGAPQTLSGPVLVIPYRYTVESTRWDNSEPVEVEGQAYFLPDELRVEARAEPETRYRGLFDATVYRAGLRVAGRFGALDLEALDLDRDKMLWDEAVLALGVTDLRGTTGEPFVSWNGAPAAFRPGTGSAPWQNGIEAPIALDPAREDPAEFGFDLPVAGSENLSFTPAGKTTAVSVASAWPHPSFDGAYLPAEREIGDDGFSARWTLSYLGRGFPQSWTSHSENLTRLSERFAASRFGVSLVTPVDFYLLSERSIKHGALFIVLIFAVIFLFEIMAPLKIHIVQYALVGFALCLFYLLLLSLAEIVGFAPAYGIAAAASAALITLYMAKILASLRRAAPIAGLLGAVYLYLYIVLQLENLALVTGALGLFVALAAVMYATRNVNWYALKRA